MIAGNGLRPAIWDEFTERFGIDRVCEFYAASEGNTAFVNVLNVDKTTGICPTPVAFVEYDDESGDPVRGEERPGAQGRQRRARTAAVQGQQLPAVRRLHRQGSHREEAGARRLQGGRRAGSTPAT